MDDDLDKELEVAKALARQAGPAIMAVYGSNFHVDFKGGDKNNPVTDADRGANRIIVEGLKKSFPNDAVLAEESPDDLHRLQCRRLWCVDPVDGTREFVNRNGQFVVMIGLAIAGEAKLGVLYQPTEDKLFYGYGKRAFIEDRRGRRPLRVSDKRRPEEAVIAVSRAHRSEVIRRVGDAMGTQAVLPVGSVGLKITALCENLADLYVTVSNQTHEWDACGPVALLQAAGGTATDIFGNPLQFNKQQTNTPHGILASNAHLHDACLAALRTSLDALRGTASAKRL